MTSPRLRLGATVSAALLSLPLTAAAVLGTAPPALAGSPNVVLSEVYGGGGNSGATLTHDFIELANPSGDAVNLSGWSVRYFSASGGAGGSTTLSGSISARGRFLIQQAKGAGGTTALPAPDATGTLTLSATNGRVDLVDATGAVVDRLGYGSASQFEGAPADATTNTTSSARRNECVDTDNNAADFATGDPTPANSAAGNLTCESGPVDPPAPVSIAQIQGAAHLSPLDGQRVAGVEGVVIAKGPAGLWIQDPTPDTDPRTSEGIYLYTRTAPGAAVGDLVRVDGVVDEYRPGGASGNDNTTITQIVTPTITVVSSGQPLPPPVMLGVDRVAPPQTIEAGNPRNVESSANEFAIERDAIDFYESLEGMHVAVRDAEVVGPTKSFGEVSVVPGGSIDALRSSFGGVVYGGYDQPNAMRVQIDDALILGQMPQANVGDRLPGLTSGVVDYSFSNYKLLATAVPAHAPTGRAREVAPVQRTRHLSVAAFNVENLAPDNPAEKFARLATQMVTNLRSPDIVALEEIQDNSGSADDGTTDAARTVNALTAAIRAAGGPAYEARWVNPANNADGGQPGGNIRNVFLYRADRGVEFVDIAGADASAASEPTSASGRRGPVTLTASPGRVDPTNPAWEDTRKPLVGQFRYLGETVFAMAVHFSSKGGDDPLFGRWQQPVRSSEAARQAQAQSVRAWADRLLAIAPDAHLVIAGDVNDFEFSDTADTIVGTIEGDGPTALTDLPRTLPESERWTYIYEGNSQVLDHIFLSPSLVGYDVFNNRPWRPGQPGRQGTAAFTYDIVHTNSPFADQDSDHDPQVVHLNVR